MQKHFDILYKAVLDDINDDFAPRLYATFDGRSYKFYFDAYDNLRLSDHMSSYDISTPEKMSEYWKWIQWTQSPNPSIGFLFKN